MEMVPTFTAARSTGEAPGSTPAASPRLRRRPSPWPPSPREQYRTRSSPPEPSRRSAPRTSPHPPDWSWRCLKRRNDTGSSRIPSRLAHRARPIRQCWADPTLSRLLPPPPATPRDGCLQLHPTATTARRRRSPTSIRTNSASWRTARSNNPVAPETPAPYTCNGLARTSVCRRHRPTPNSHQPVKRSKIANPIHLMHRRNVARVGLTAPAACTPSGECDDEPPQTHRWVRV